MPLAPALQRVIDVGVSVDRVARTSVVIKIGDVPANVMPYHPAAALCRGLTGVGFGRVWLCGAIQYFNDLAKELDGSSFCQEPGSWLPATVWRQMPAADIVIDLSNDLSAAQTWLRQATSQGTLCLAVTWSSTRVNMWTGSALTDPAARADAGSRAAGMPFSPISRIAAGLALQEAVLHAGRVRAVAPPAPVVTCDMPDMSGSERHDPALGQAVALRGKVIDVIGLGGIGCHTVEALVPLLGPGCTLNLFDFDNVAPENIGLQITYTSADVGRPKAHAFAARLADTVAGGASIRPYAIPYEARPRNLPRPHVRISCPDTWAARYWLSEQCLRDGVPLVDAGSAPLATQVRVCLPGRTACLAHQIPGLRDKVAEERDSASCAANPALTLPGTNMIAGGLLAANICAILDDRCSDLRPLATAAYDARCPERFGLARPRAACAHGLLEADHRLTAGDTEWLP